MAGGVSQFERPIRLHRYIFGQLLLAASIAIAVFVFVLVVANVLKKLADPFAAGQLTPGMFAYLVAIVIPSVLPYALPLGLLSSVLMVLGRLSAQSELVAMKAAGLSLWRIAVPVFALGLIGVVISTLINIYYAPIAQTAFRQTLESAAQEDPLRFIAPKTFIKDFDGYVIFADGRQGKELRNIHVWELDEEQRAVKHLHGQRAYLDFDREEAAIILTVFDANGQIINPELSPSEVDSSNVIVFDQSQFRLPLAELFGDDAGGGKLSHRTLEELIQQQQEAAAAEDSGDADAFGERIEIQTAIQKKFALSFAVLSLCIVAIPLGIKASRSETYANFALAFALAIAYFVLFTLCSWVEKTPALRPDLVIWAPNLLFQGLGLGLFLRVAKR